MPSVSHESLVELFRDRPELAIELLRGCAGMEVTADGCPRVTAAEFAELAPAEYRADVVIRLDSEDGRALRIVIVEVQLDRDRQKHFSWPLYLTGARARFRCPVTLLVVAMDEAVAAWCRRGIPLDDVGSVLRPVVLGPGQLPRVMELGRAYAFPELAVLSAVAHGHDEDAAELAVTALGACQRLDSQRSTRYADFVMASLGEAARRALEALMNQHKYEYQSEFARRYVQQGREEGREEGLRAVVLRLLAKRFGPLSRAVQERVEHADTARLEVWVDRLLTAGTLDEVLSG